ncbi:cell wall-associated NlpC family hydrolase [Streptomyces sp. KhCrAH-43]|uniref:C40 family peptidase n=1 Tax=unclassified Streptomyces TaxID=2593676 RepID=UPI0003600177|nr:NlpC/P60 family protein [Streptomyces sp. KhCrAH-43]MYS37987.1 glycoside hydrolase [Streptomyces sp. SID4920]MYX66174.1 glycoside hydrolase [Streptomyces sp. SID8373]RAJ67658.1 cell wall-associated NlpC family hydrolase [Streptomyces sp. KhCrAH-43]
MSSGTLVRSFGTAALAAVVVVSPAAAVAAPSPAPPAPGAPAGGVAGLLSELQKLYQQAEEATETYNGTAAELKKRAARAKKLDAALVTARRSLADSRDAAGQLAREQYQGRSELSAYLRLLLMRDPEAALTQGQVIQRLAAGRAASVRRLGTAEKRAGELAKESRKVLAEQRTLAARKKKDRDTVRTRLKQVEAKIATLSAAQLDEVSGLAQKNTDKAQDALVASGALSSSRPPTAQGGEAVGYAVRQIGKPYVWGAEGPGSFDCSGLTSQAWASAGRVIPRTSQEQWRQLTRVPMNALRPGDLVVYFPKATHVALYIGNGLVVQAPRPGTSVKVSPVASNPVLGAVRPDPDGSPLASYQGPELPDGATDGSDEGYGASSAPAS